MIKHTVQNHIHAGLVGQLHQLFQILLIAERGINPVIVVDIVLMGRVRAKNRRHVEDIHPQIFDVVKMIDNAPQ